MDINRIVIVILTFVISGCDSFSLGSNAFKNYEKMCSDFGGLDRAYFYLSTQNILDENIVVLKKLECKNGVILDYDYVKKHYISEDKNGTTN